MDISTKLKYIPMSIHPIAKKLITIWTYVKLIVAGLLLLFVSDWGVDHQLNDLVGLILWPVLGIDMAIYIYTTRAKRAAKAVQNNG